MTSNLVGNNAVLPRSQALYIEGLAGDYLAIWAVILPVTVLKPLQDSRWITYPVINLDAQVAC